MQIRMKKKIPKKGTASGMLDLTTFGGKGGREENIKMN